MACDALIWGLLFVGCSIQILWAISEDNPSEYMNKEEREALKEEARDMFYHAYNAYMDNAYPADELMPLSCKGRYRGSEPNRGDIDSTLGNFSLTLVDTLDTLVVLGDLEEFENAVKLVARDVNFDTDVIVSLFETNIRMLGGLLSGHILAEYLQQRADIMPWYRGELLDLAKDLGYRFLPAFNTTTGIPYGRINLKRGMKGVPVEISRETCTACAGSMILEMAALSRLTGEPIFEEKAQKAMDVLWRMRHRGTDLMGSVLNVNSGDWVRRDSGVGAGIDSYYEYCLKAYILLGDEKYLGRFNKHYQAVMKYVSQGPMLLDVHMHRPNTNSKNFMDALLAFWPGLQVLKGDIKPAVETHEMLYQVMQRHNFIPEAFTTDFQVHWGHHPLRPEFLESTYFLYRATGDHYYLGVGRKVLKSLQTYARVPCGYAAVSDVRTNKHDDTMDSFVLSETFKYLFLLFVEPGELVLDLDEFIFTTEGHLLPLTLASIRTNISSDFERDIVYVDEFDRTCPNSLHLFPATVRQPLRNMVEDVCPRRSVKRRLSASQFQANNLEHLKMLSDMGITTLTLTDGRVQLLHTFSNAKTPQDSEEGLLFMQEMVELTKMQIQPETKPQTVTFTKPNTDPPEKITLLAGPAQFGLELQNFDKITGKVIFTYPPAACTDLLNADRLAGKIVIMDRGNCMFIEKARRIQQAGALAGIVLDNVAGSSAATSPMFAMSGDGKEIDDVTIPVVFLFFTEAAELMTAINMANGDLTVTLGIYSSKEEIQLKAPTDLSLFERLKGSLKSFLSRHVTQQATTITSNLDMMIPIESPETQEDALDFHYFHAEIIKDSLGGEVRITAASEATIIILRPVSTPIEILWHQLKEVFVNQIFLNTKQNKGIRIRSCILESYYNWINKARGVLMKTSLSYKVRWFLSELLVVAPNSSIKKMGQLLEPNKQKLLKQYLLTNMDTMVLNLKTIATKLKNVKSVSPEMEQLLKISESGITQVENYSFLRHLLTDLFDEEEEILNQHVALLDRIHAEVHTTYQEILIDGVQRHLEKSGVEDSSYYDILIADLQKNLKNIDKKENILKKTKENNLAVAEFISDSNTGKSELERKNLRILKKIKESSTEKLEDFEYFILTEIEKAVKYSEQNILQKYEDISDESKNIMTKNKKDKNIVKSGEIILYSSQNQSESENRENKVRSSFQKEIDFLQLTKVVDAKFKKTTTDKKIEKSSADSASSGTNKIHIFDASMTKDTSNTRITSPNNKHTLLQGLQKDISDIQHSHKTDLRTKTSNRKDFIENKIISTDLLEEFKNPIWVINEKKVFQKKPQMANMLHSSTKPNKVKYDKKKYMSKDKAKSSTAKHIDNEL
ncbi:PREDICTED: ER degradation-enhancing alpha-mannosidase-like protein 3 isoform X1 [Trachymyrmex cornetzi]|uniref:alpha-1,2-Mannosidase n=1 Tax=Trachymyrmex cornetzi TaxID=471704 RepID=A0A151J3F9_9HYME|nr:PREDICTED: ER degradation-enhancing alpha-mannosidase-like protein 3 isoform X1 [Trachymyrmex cornetzi]KYN16708.1 ER degradation-enhancing alpha-mannosidase-like 3 [Trachymyrmex cornetzi]